MQPRTLLGLLLVVLVWLTPLAASGQSPSLVFTRSTAAFDEATEAELAALDPNMVEPWRTANEARDADEFERAIAAYSVVIEAVPQFDHALRRRCSTHMRAQHWADALADCEAASKLSNSLENAGALAMVLAEAPSPIGDPAGAKVLARRVLDSQDVDMTYLGACQTALAVQDVPLLRRCVNTLRAAHPDTWETHFFASFAHAFDGDLDDAQDEIDRARELGLDDDIHAQISASFTNAEPPLSRWGRRAGVIALLWVSLAAALIAAGFALSKLTLSEAERALTNPEASAHAKDSMLRRAYAWVLWACCAYYYLSVPLVLLSVVALGAAIVLGFLYIGFLPIKLLVLVGIVVFVTLGAVLKSFFTKVSEEPPGELLDLDEAPGLREVLDEVAAKVGTRPVDHVYLEVGTSIAVFERGGMLDKLRGKGERCLLLGVAVLDGLDTQALQAILAHEYGHFSNEDTAGGNFALAVRRSIMSSAMGLAQAGVADWYNPSWLFLRGFHNVFLRISQGASRLQEVLADRWSARTYGAESFERGLRHVIAAELRFDAHANAALKEIIEAKQAMSNLYEHQLAEPATDESEVAAKVEEIINEPPSPYDSHPRPADRFRWARAISRRGGDDARASEPAWALFGDRKDIEARMTELIRARVQAQTGVKIPAVLRGRGKRRRRGGDGDGDGAEAAEAPTIT